MKIRIAQVSRDSPGIKIADGIYYCTEMPLDKKQISSLKKEHGPVWESEIGVCCLVDGVIHTFLHMPHQK